jgi:Bacterial Ig domain
LGGITVTPTLANGMLSVTAPLTLAVGSHTLTIQAKGNNPDGTINPTLIEKSMSLTVQSANIAPVATVGSTTIPYGGTATLEVSQLATDANGDALIITAATSSNGTIVISSDKKSLIFTPANEFS